MRKWVTGGRVYADGKFKDADLLLENGRIGAVVCHGTPVSGDEIYDARGHYVVPGFVDIHTHGGCGVDVNAASKDDFEKIGRFFAGCGTTSWLCSILTDTPEQTFYCIQQARPIGLITKLCRFNGDSSGRPVPGQRI